MVTLKGLSVALKVLEPVLASLDRIGLEKEALVFKLLLLVPVILDGHLKFLARLTSPIFF